jgi:hypothetical protein
MGRPSTPNTKYFQRTLSDPEKQIMLAAGQGNICRGFENILAMYQEAHNQGFRPDMDMSILITDRATTDSPDTERSLRDRVRESIGNV